MTPGQIAFEAYNTSKGGLTWDGKPIPPWPTPDPKVAEAWEAAARGLMRAYSAPEEHLEAYKRGKVARDGAVALVDDLLAEAWTEVQKLQDSPEGHLTKVLVDVTHALGGLNYYIKTIVPTLKVVDK